MAPTTGPSGPLDPTKQVGPAQQVGKGSRAKHAEQPGALDGTGATGAAAFRALLERLEVQAQSLAQEKEGVDRPEHLSQATELARETLDGALELRDQLLEAYRQAQSQKAELGERGPTEGDTE